MGTNINLRIVTIRWSNFEHRRLHFTVSFLRGHILYHGCVDFPVEDFFAILRHTAVDPAVLRPLSSLALSIVKSYSQELLLVNNNVAEVLSGLYAADKAGVADAIEETLLEWINQLGVLGSLHRTKNFEKLALKILKKLQKVQKILDNTVRILVDLLMLLSTTISVEKLRSIFESENCLKLKN